MSKAGKPADGYVDPASGRKCGWASGGYSCTVPDCKFPGERCIVVKRNRGES